VQLCEQSGVLAVGEVLVTLAVRVCRRLSKVGSSFLAGAVPASPPIWSLALGLTLGMRTARTASFSVNLFASLTLRTKTEEWRFWRLCCIEKASRLLASAFPTMGSMRLRPSVWSSRQSLITSGYLVVIMSSSVSHYGIMGIGSPAAITCGDTKAGSTN
jgi:hypothetical protein